MDITKDTVLLYAAHNYNNPHCASLNDFHEDIKRFIIARTLIRNYHKKRKIRIRLLLNHIIICTNMFGNEGASRLFLHYCEPELWPYLSAIFDFLQIAPDDFLVPPDKNIQDILQRESQTNKY